MHICTPYTHLIFYTSVVEQIICETQSVFRGFTQIQDCLFQSTFKISWSGLEKTFSLLYRVWKHTNAMQGSGEKEHEWLAYIPCIWKMNIHILDIKVNLSAGVHLIPEHFMLSNDFHSQGDTSGSTLNSSRVRWCPPTTPSRTATCPLLWTRLQITTCPLVLSRSGSKHLRCHVNTRRTFDSLCL